MTTAIAPATPGAPSLSPQVMESLIGSGDLSRMSPGDRVAYYDAVCQSVGLNPLTKPFEFISFQGRTVMYCTAAGCQQLAGMHGISLEIVERVSHPDACEVVVRAKFRDGRTVDNIGIVPLVGDQKTGHVSAQTRIVAQKKAVTQAYRRAVLSAVGLAFPSTDELPDGAGYSVDAPVAADPTTGEIREVARPLPPPAPEAVPQSIREKISDCQDVDDINMLLTNAIAEGWGAQPWGEQAKRLVSRYARDAGYVWDAELGEYGDPHGYDADDGEVLEVTTEAEAYQTALG